MKRGAIFDMDGTLFDTERIYRDAWMQLPPKFGYTPDPAFPEAVRGTAGERVRVLAEKYYPGIDVEAFVADCRTYVDNVLQAGVPVKPGVREVLEYFFDWDMPMAIASSARIGKIMHCLNASGLAPYFSVIVSGKDVEETKPAPDIFLLACDRLGYLPEECYVFEDAPNGVFGSAAAGCYTVMISDLVEPGEEVRRVCAGVYRDFFAVRRALEAGIL